MCVRAVLFKACEVRSQFRRFFTKNGLNFVSNLNDDFCEDFFGVYYVSVRRKLVILGVLPVFF